MKKKKPTDRTKNYKSDKRLQIGCCREDGRCAAVKWPRARETENTTRRSFNGREATAGCGWGWGGGKQQTIMSSVMARPGPEMNPDPVVLSPSSPSSLRLRSIVFSFFSLRRPPAPENRRALLFRSNTTFFNNSNFNAPLLKAPRRNRPRTNPDEIVVPPSCPDQFGPRNESLKPP